MTNEEALKKLTTLIENNDDLEKCHIEADKILMEILLGLGYREVVKLYETLDKWYA